MQDDKVKLNSFPSNSWEAIAYLYVKNQDLSGKTPEEIYDLYHDALLAARKRHDAIKHGNI